MTGLWLAQVMAVVRLEMKKTFLSRRGLWVYLLAFGPAALFLGHSVYAPRQREHWAKLAAAHPVSTEALNSVQIGQSQEQVVEKLGQPYHQFNGYDPDDREQRSGLTTSKYTDGRSDVRLVFSDGKLERILRKDLETMPQNAIVFATVFQSYYLRLAVFFGCVGIFINLFRGEMLDKSLHFYLLTPVRREVLLAGKYLAGLLATVVIFTSSTAMQLAAMLWQFDRGAVAGYLAGPGWSQAASYLGITALACVGYGSVFLAVGLLFRNPIIPTAIVLLWESVNPFLPAALKKISMIYYLESLCPVVATPGHDLPPLLYLLISPTQPATPAVAIGGIVLLTILVLVVAGRLARKLEINYSTD